LKRLYKLTRQILPTLLFLLSAVIIAQEANVENRAIQNYRVMFYNLENLFDMMIPTPMMMNLLPRAPEDGPTKNSMLN